MNSIRNNGMAASTANSLASHYSRLSTSMRRLSSGLRVNSAADDAAGLAIRELMRSDIAAMRQGARNANDAISLLQVADGALGVIDEKLIRMKELAEQAATGTYNSTQRLMIDSEFQAMGSEIDRIARATDFNGIKLLDGSLSSAHDGSGLAAKGALKIHFGSGNDSAEDYYYIKIDDCSTIGLGLRQNGAKATPGFYKWLKGANIDRDNMKLDFKVSGGQAGSGDSAFARGIDYFALPIGLSNVTITSNCSQTIQYHKPHVCLFDKDGVQYTGPPIIDRDWVFTTTAGGMQTSDSTSSWWNNMTPEQFLEIGKKQGAFNSSVTALSKSPDIGAMITGGSTINAFGTTLESVTGINEIKAANTQEIYKIGQLTGDVLFFIGGHENPTGGCNMYNLDIQADIDDNFLRFVDSLPDEDTFLPGPMIQIDTQEKAQETLVTLKNATISKDMIRAHLGAMQNRLENTVTNLTMQTENLQAAESRISDTDVAREMTAFVRNQVLTQAAVAMLGQANAQPQMLAQLLNS